MSRRRRSGFDADSIRQLKIAFILLVGFSGTMMGIYGGGPLELIILTTVVGIVAGMVLLWYFSWLTN